EDVTAPRTQCTPHADLLAALTDPEARQADNARCRDGQQYAADHAHQDCHAAVGVIGAAAYLFELANAHFIRQHTHAIRGVQGGRDSLEHGVFLTRLRADEELLEAAVEHDRHDRDVITLDEVVLDPRRR